MLAYPLSRRTFYGRGAIIIFMMITMFFDGGLIPTYLLMKDLHLLDTRWAMWLPGALAVFQVIVARTFFQSSIPDELREAAEVDGCKDIRYLVSVVLPLSKPILAVMTLMYAVGHWNAYFDALIYLRSENLFPLQYVLRNLLILNAADPAMLANTSQQLRDQGFEQVLKYALIVVASIPILIMYPFVQRHFVKGVMVGSLKGRAFAMKTSGSLCERGRRLADFGSGFNIRAGQAIKCCSLTKGGVRYEKILDFNVGACYLLRLRIVRMQLCPRNKMQRAAVEWGEQQGPVTDDVFCSTRQGVHGRQ